MLLILTGQRFKKISRDPGPIVAAREVALGNLKEPSIKQHETCKKVHNTFFGFTWIYHHNRTMILGFFASLPGQLLLEWMAFSRFHGPCIFAFQIMLLQRTALERCARMPD